MPSNKRPPLEMDDLTDNLKQSSGKGMGAFFPTPPSSQKNEQEEKTDKVGTTEAVKESVSQKESNTINSIKTNKENNSENNVISNITILQITEKDIEDLRELAEKPQTYRLTHKDIEYVKDTAYKLSKESKRGKIGQGDILRIALLLFEKFITSNKADLKAILDKIK